MYTSTKHPSVQMPICAFKYPTLASVDGSGKGAATVQKALEGKTWEGKEVVVEAFASFAEKANVQDLRKRITADVVKVSRLLGSKENKADFDH